MYLKAQLCNPGAKYLFTVLHTSFKLPTDAYKLISPSAPQKRSL